VVTEAEPPGQPTDAGSLSDAGLLGVFEPDDVLYGTHLGAQMVGDSQALLALLPEESVDLIVTSPPFALLREKSYGNESQAAYVQWLAGFGKAALRVLKPTGSLVLDLGHAYQRGSAPSHHVSFRTCWWHAYTGGVGVSQADPRPGR